MSFLRNLSADEIQYKLIRKLAERAISHQNVFVAPSASFVERLIVTLEWADTDTINGLLTPFAHGRWVTQAWEKPTIHWQVCSVLPGKGTPSAFCFIWRKTDEQIADAALLLVDDTEL